MNVLVLGASGYFGRRVLAALRRAPELDATAGGRAPASGGVRVDLTDPSTFPALRDFAVVVNCADSTRAGPDGAAAYCGSHGGIFIETTTEAAVIQRLWETRRDRAAWRGALLIGAGIFPGLSNLLAAAVARRVIACRRLELGFRIDVLSGAGGGMLAVMAGSMVRPAVYYEGGVRREAPPIAAGVTLPFAGRLRATVRLGLPEAAMLHWSTGTLSTGTFLAAAPPVPGPVADALGRWLARHPGAERAIGAQLRLVRGTLFRGRPTSIELTAVANREESMTDPPHETLRAADGVTAGAYAAAAMVALLARRPPAPGVYLPDQLFELDDVLRAMAALAGGAPLVARQAPARPRAAPPAS
ncbi:MAG TPA: hypothetical protein VNA89_01600 [Gemmatimonadaceae bacterium]|nr:hypothetical protein [Gemmatimonadaceae bacterium]